MDDRWVKKADPVAMPAPRPVPVLGLGVAMALAAFFVLIWLYRSNTGLDQAVFIGEDFPVFWWQAHLDPAGSAIDPYAGYFHLVPRLAGVVSVAFSGVSAPLVFLVVYLAALFAVAVALIKSNSVIGLSVLAAILVAPNTGEVFASITYFQWISAPILVGLYLGGPPVDRTGRIAWALAILVTGFSGPFSAIVAPIAAMELVLMKLRGLPWQSDRRRLVACLAVMACGAVSVLAYVAVGSEQIAGGAETHLAKVAKDAFAQVFAVLGQGAFEPVRWPALALLVLVGIATVLPPYRWEKMAFAGFAGLVALAAIHKFRFDPAAFASAEFGTRYFFIGLVSILTILALTVFGDWRGKAAAVLALAVVAGSYETAKWRGPARAPVDWNRQVEAIRTDGWSSVFVNPFWNFVVTSHEGRSQLYWVHQTTQPDQPGPIEVIPIGPTKSLRLTGQVASEQACGISIPVVTDPSRKAASGDALWVQVWSRSLSTGEERRQAFVIPTARLTDWSTVSVGTGQVGPQEVSVQLDALAWDTLHVALPGRSSSAPWQGIEVDSQRTFPAFVWTMACTLDSPFGRLPGSD